MRVNFFIVGAARSGTSALFSFLNRHPQVFIPKIKEIHYFDMDVFGFRYRLDKNYYHGFFNKRQDQEAIGDATPHYMYWLPAAKRIYNYNPHSKLIFILRNPVDRAYSHYHMEKNRKREKLSFKKAYKYEAVRINRSIKNRQIHSYFDRGLYTKQIKRFLKYFPKDQMLFIKTKNLKTNHHQVLKKTFKFIGVTSDYKIAPQEVSAQNYPPMSKQDRSRLVAMYNKEISSLEKLLSWDLSDWTK